MSDEQWLWMYVNMALDDDEEREGMCEKCLGEREQSHTKCSRCGKPLVITSGADFVNPNFDENRFNRMMNE